MRRPLTLNHFVNEHFEQNLIDYDRFETILRNVMHKLLMKTLY